MAPEKEGGRTRRKAGAGRGDQRAGRPVEKDTGQGREVAVVDFDPWSTLFDGLWGQPAEGGSAERHDDGRGPAKGARVAGTKAGR
jgi:hypothetical protein